MEKEKMDVGNKKIFLDLIKDPKAREAVMSDARKAAIHAIATN